MACNTPCALVFPGSSSFRQVFYCRDIPGQPVDEMPVGRIEVVRQQRQAIGGRSGAPGCG